MSEKKCLNLSTIIDLVVGNSEKGALYYRRMKEIAEEPLAVEIFHRLTEEEEEHRRALIKIARVEAEKGQIIIDEETYCYLCAIGEDLILPYNNNVEFKATSPRDALEIGLQAKKDAMLLYHELQKRCVSEEARNILMHLLETEQRYLLELRHYMYEICPTGCKHPPKNGNNS